MEIFYRYEGVVTGYSLLPLFRLILMSDRILPSGYSSHPHTSPRSAKKNLDFTSE